MKKPQTTNPEAMKVNDLVFMTLRNDRAIIVKISTDGTRALLRTKDGYYRKAYLSHLEPIK